MKYRNFDEIIKQLEGKDVLSRVVVAAANDDHTLGAVKMAVDKGLIKPVLVGHKEEILKVCKEVGLEVPDEDIYDEPDDAAAAWKAVDLIHEGKAEVLMKGKLDSNVYLKAVINKEHGLRKEDAGTISVFTAHEVPTTGRIYVPVEGGMIPYPTLEQKRDIIQNTVNAMISLGWTDIKVGVLACKEKMDPKMPETVDADELKKMNERGEITGCIVDGPVSFDCACSKEIAEFKGYDSPIAGECDVLLAPNIHAGNIMGKMMSVLCGSRFGSFLVGTTYPVVFSSRGSTSDEKFVSICLAAISAMNSKGE
ncbi:MAG: phosphate butyryltransferase [Lachnospiraceae bacterium]|nr:phosphate butyryltransferase [Lachnospiraceae bacterium]